MQKKLHIYLLLALASWLLPLSAYTQTYPVTISTQLTQPSPIYLSNYANTASINSPIKVQLILNDLSIMNRQVRLKCYFQGAVSFVTNDFVVGASPIYLEGGFPTQLTNVELGPYFEFQNIKGINPNQYGQPLPEGIYTISFEVYDFATNKKLSKKSSVTTVIFQNEPPFLNLPANQAGIMEQNIQNIIFSWTPRSINVSNVEYDFSLVEIWNTNTPLQNAFAYSPPLYTATTRNTTVQYSIAEPQLIPGKTYAWRVKAKALLGAEEIGVFKNNGYSETYSFKYLSFCKPPLAITTTDVSQEQGKVTWSGAVDNFDYQVNYREKNADSKWYKLVTPREYVLISNLKPKTTYEYTVGAACDPGEYTHSNIQEFTTLAQDEIAFTGCGIKPDPTALSNKTPLPALFPNDVVTAGDFPIVVLKSTGSNGTFSGEGYVTLPFLAKFRELIDAAAALAGSDENGDSKVNIGKYTRIRITFNNIGVNTDFKLISGEIVASYDPNWGSMINGDKAVNDLLGDTGTVIPIDVQFEIKSVVKNADGTLTITGTNGLVVTQPKTDNDVVITDRNGKQYAVSPNAPVGDIKQSGKAAPGGVPTPQNTNGMGSGGAITQISSPDVSVTFTTGTGYYSLDENPNQDPKLKDNTKLNSTYDVIPKKDGSNYYVHYKAISDAPKAEDLITAKATFSNGKTAADVVFKTENGTEIPSTWSGNVATLTLKRTLDFAKESILATVKPPVQKDSIKVTKKYDIAGALNLWHLSNKKVNVTLVGLNGGQTPTQSQAQEYLNSIYGKAGIQFEINTIKIDIAQSWGTSIETGDSDLLNTYTNGQLTITNDFQTQLGSSYKNDTYYVFFAGVPASKSGVLGFMPLKRQFGFIFSQSDDKKLRTLAHELGHGIFGLQHPFTSYNTTVTTDLLMDYGTGTSLSHNDWEIMHAPGLQLYQFTQGSSDGELAGGLWYTTKWITFKAKPEYIPVIEASSDLRPEGTIRKIFIAKENAYYNYVPEKGDYFKDNEKIPLKIDTSTKLSNSSKNVVYLYKYEGGCGKDTYYKSTNDMVLATKSDINKLLNTLKPEGIFSCSKPTFNDLKETGKEIYTYNKSQVPEKDTQILIEIASIGDKIGKDNYSSYITKIRNDGNLFWSNSNKSALYTTENLNNTLASLKKFSDAIQRIKTSNYKTINELVEDVDNNFKITKGSDNIFVFPSDMKMTQLLTTPFADLDAKRTIFLLDLIKDADFNITHKVGDPICAEQILASILNKFSKENNIEEKKIIIDHIRSKKYLNKFVNINGIYYESFINSMITMVHQVYKAPVFKVNPERFLTFSPAYLQLNSESISEEGKVELKVKQWFSNDKYNLIIDPYEYVTIRFVDDVDFGGNFQFKKNQSVQMSAICAYQMFHKDTQNAKWKSARIAGEVALTVIGIGEITAAIRLYRAGQTAYATYIGIKALGDVGFGLMDIYINNSDNSLTDAQKDKWNKFFMIYSIASISTTGLELLTNKVVTKLKKGGNSYNEFEKAVEEANIDIDQLYKEHIENSAKISGNLADQLDLISKRLPANLQEQFNKDFANASEEIVKALSKENSELINGWKKFRKNNPTSILCN